MTAAASLSFPWGLARNSDIPPIIAIAGKAAAYVESHLDRCQGDAVVDYHSGIEAAVNAVKNLLEKAGHSSVRHVIDDVVIP
ncbi:hypothetical protein BJY01DRAFT_251505 [Aspergillus pseudoustus]|uniref:Uncharacterized protein n=1 Tax=Aspergillus pseudoustus TaxID=1810923 RepID=A0ABR4JBM4_9EURO